MRPLLMATMLGVLVGCAASQPASPRPAFDQARAACQAEFPERVGNYLALARCEAPAVRTYFTAIGMPRDRIDRFLALRADVGAHADAGEAPRAGGDLDVSHTGPGPGG